MAVECGFGRISQYKKRSNKPGKISEIWTRKSVYQNTNFAALQMSGRFISALGGTGFAPAIGIGLLQKSPSKIGGTFILNTAFYDLNFPFLKPQHPGSRKQKHRV